MLIVVALSEHVTRNIWGGIASLVACLVVWLVVTLLFAWDDPDKAGRDANREAMRELTGGLFNDRTADEVGRDRRR